MVEYSCEKCGKEFYKKSHFNCHNRRKTPCKKNDDKINIFIDKENDDKFEKLNDKNLIIDKDKDKNITNINKINNKSPLRYPGGKTRACKKLELILKDCFDINKFNTIISPFFGGGSFEFYIQNNYELNIIANDKFNPLYNFWKTCKSNKENLCKELIKKLDLINKEEFTNFRKNIMEEKNNFKQSIMFFILNRCSFSGATLSGGFSEEASKKRFTKSSIDAIKKLNLTNYDIYNLDFEEFINNNNNQDKKNLIFLDPPYYLEKASKLYGNNGDMHDTFDHDKLYKCISKEKNWLMTYNNCDYIKKLYKDFKIIETSWSYGMNKSKKSSELIIIG